MSVDTSTRLTCPKCGTPNAPGAAFCANCGNPMGGSPTGAGQASHPPPSWPPPPSQPPMTGAQAQASLAMPGQSAYAAVIAAAGAMGRVTGQQPPSLVQFEVTRKSWWTTGFGIRYRTEAMITQAGPRESLVRIGSKIDWASATPLFVITGVCALVALFIMPVLFVLIGVIVSGVNYYRLANGAQSVAQDAAQGIGSAAPQGWAPQAASTPGPQPAWPQPERPASPPQPQSVSHEALRQLKALHDTGVISDEEYTAKKAELLARL